MIRITSIHKIVDKNCRAIACVVYKQADWLPPTHLYFEVINHKIINHLPRSIIKFRCIPSSVYLVISLKLAKSFSFGSILATNSEANKGPPKMIYLSTLGAYWNEYGTSLNEVKNWEKCDCNHSASLLSCTTVSRFFFCKFLMGGLKIFHPRWSPMGTKSDGEGGPCKKNLTEAETAHLVQN